MTRLWNPTGPDGNAVAEADGEGVQSGFPLVGAGAAFPALEDQAVAVAWASYFMMLSWEGSYIMQRMGTLPNVAVTGACGRIGRALVAHLAAQGYPLTLIDRFGSGLAEMADLGVIVELDLATQAAVDLFAGVEVVVHLAGEAGPDASWESLLPANIQAPYNVATAAMRAGCRRLIVASSVHAVSACAHRPVVPDDAVAPADLYGVTKCFVEALAFWCAHRGAMSAAAVRIGAFQTVAVSREEGSAWMADVFIAVPDLVALLERAISAQYHFAILHAAAPGHDVLLDVQETERLLGWRAHYRFPAPTEL